MIPAFLYPCFLCETPNDFKMSIDSASLSLTPKDVILDLEPAIVVTKADLAFTGSSVDLVDSTVDVVALSGTLGAPNSYLAISIYPKGAAKQYLRANTDGKLEEATRTLIADPGAYVQIGSEWVSPLNTYSGSYWIRATKISGDTLDSGTLGSWLALTSSREWLLSAYRSQAIGGVEYKETLLKLEISTDVSGSPIVATGYYKIAAEYDTLV